VASDQCEKQLLKLNRSYKQDLVPEWENCIDTNIIVDFLFNSILDFLFVLDYFILFFSNTILFLFVIDTHYEK
jgi:hypothetical protein